MPTNLGIDEKLLVEALRVGGQKTKKATVNEALREFIAHRKRVQGLKLFGAIDYDPRLNRKQKKRARR
jgi:Arc/MetJ family transcription regulator